MAGFGRRMIMGGLGCLFLTRSLLGPLGRWLWPCLILMWFMWGAGRGCIGLICRLGTVFISLPMRARPGRTWGCGMGSRYRRLLLIHVILTNCWWRWRGILMGLI